MSGVDVRDVRIPMRDGALLAADIVRLADGGAAPALLVRTPYSRAAMRLVHDVVGLARDGWTVVVQDVRGRFDSEGVFDAFTQELADGYDTVDWCARQLWCDGRVAMTGWSYVGATQWLAALGGHPALLAINPIVGAGDIADAMLAEGGAFQVGLVQPWVLGLAASDPAGTAEVRARAGALGAQWEQTLRLAPGADPVAELLPGYAAWRRGITSAATVTDRYEELDVAVFQITGWYDIFCESALRHWQGMLGSRRPRRLVIGPWSHSNGLSNLHPEMDFGAAANGVYAGVTGAALGWMRDALNGRQVASGISCFVMHEGWRELASWPPPGREVVLYLGEEGLLLPTPSRDGADVIRHDPADPVPTRGGRVLGPFLPMPGPVDQRIVEARDDVLVYTTEPLAEDVVLMGMVRGTFRVQSTASSIDVTVKLCDVQPDGRSFNIVDSVRRRDLVPGTWVDVDVDVGSAACRVRRGHLLRLHVSGSNFPRFDVNPGSAGESGTATVLHPAEHRVAWGSQVRLPVVS